MESPTWRAASISPMPTSVVTGGAGFLGSHLCDAYANQARYLTQAYGICEAESAHRHVPLVPRFATSGGITDEGWQSGLLHAPGA